MALLSEGRAESEKAFSLFQSVIEYHVPKLAGTEQTISDLTVNTIQYQANIVFK